jgi:23S rRNA (adenine2503-C2)-methyltransferase
MKDIKNFDLQELQGYMLSIGEKAYRAKEIFQAIYKEHIKNFANITTLPRELRERLSEEFYIYVLKEDSQINSSDGTTKYLFKLKDNFLIETVLIKETNKFGRKRNTVCVSTQVGCSLGCKFCATGQMGLSRNLYAGEIVEQFMMVDNVNPINNIVFMGMGEPLLNYDNVKKSISILIDKDGRAFGKRKITISTSGIIEKIYKLSDELKAVNLALSLHAADQSKRNELMPNVEENPMDKLSETLNYYYEKTGNTITLEYLLIKDFNDKKEDAKKLVKFISNLKSAKVNLIHYNTVPFVKFEPSKSEIEFQKFLLDKNIRATLRRSKGTEISAACGQLATKKL